MIEIALSAETSLSFPLLCVPPADVVMQPRSQTGLPRFASFQTPLPSLIISETGDRVKGSPIPGRVGVEGRNLIGLSGIYCTRSRANRRLPTWTTMPSRGRDLRVRIGDLLAVDGDAALVRRRVWLRRRSRPAWQRVKQVLERDRGLGQGDLRHVVGQAGPGRRPCRTPRRPLRRRPGPWNCATIVLPRRTLASFGCVLFGIRQLGDPLRGQIGQQREVVLHQRRGCS